LGPLGTGTIGGIVPPAGGTSEAGALGRGLDRRDAVGEAFPLGEASIDGVELAVTDGAGVDAGTDGDSSPGASDGTDTGPQLEVAHPSTSDPTTMTTVTRTNPATRRPLIVFM
jgi:hypothetical protein